VRAFQSRVEPNCHTTGGKNENFFLKKEVQVDCKFVGRAELFRLSFSSTANITASEKSNSSNVETLSLA
jgi:hypothetical protein